MSGPSASDVFTPPPRYNLVMPSLPAEVEHPGQISAVTNTEARLPEIDASSLSLHHALHNFKPLDDKYASKPLEDAFNWSELLLPEEVQGEWYCVGFRSRKKPGYNVQEYYEAIRKVREEAVENGGLLLYWSGAPDPETGFGLATYIWRSRADAIAKSPEHSKAKRLAPSLYETFYIDRYILRKRRGSTRIYLEKYIGGEVGQS
ncbi:hypothetical protein ACEPAH_6559 [Sanghuangporus vaninii]